MGWSFIWNKRKLQCSLLVFSIDFHDLNGRWMEHRARTGPCSMDGVTINADSVCGICIHVYRNICTCTCVMSHTSIKMQ